MGQGQPVGDYGPMAEIVLDGSRMTGPDGFYDPFFARAAAGRSGPPFPGHLIPGWSPRQPQCDG